MLKLIEIDDSVTLQQQMTTEAGPVILINQFKVKPEEADQMVDAWQIARTKMRQLTRVPSIKLIARPAIEWQLSRSNKGRNQLARHMPPQVFPSRDKGQLWE
jgi:hypothetical protein